MTAAKLRKKVPVQAKCGSSLVTADRAVKLWVSDCDVVVNTPKIFNVKSVIFYCCFARWQLILGRSLRTLITSCKIIVHTVAGEFVVWLLICLQPQHSLPDVLMWLICEKRRVAYCKFPAGDLIYAPNEMIGKCCGTRQTIMLKVRYCIRTITW